MSKQCSILDHSADIGLELTGDTAEELFEAAAEGMFSILTDLHSISRTEQHEITVKAASYDDLLIVWLQELLYNFSVNFVLYAGFSVQINTLNNGILILNSTCEGEYIDHRKHEIYTEIKTVTYHQLMVKKTHTNWQGSVIFDI